ncbi:MAG: hypothetical protein WC683_19995 [bacterium]|jgi:hypothetical protein
MSQFLKKEAVLDYLNGRLAEVSSDLYYPCEVDEEIERLVERIEQGEFDWAGESE